jgi:cytochrome oxidase Cu insertion factor (SCO1/SenC/PrrC family)
VSFRYPFQALAFAVFLIVRGSFAADTEADTAAIRKLLSDASDVGLPVGAAAPAFKLRDQNGRERDFASLTGPKGLVLVFFRSADW